MHLLLAEFANNVNLKNVILQNKMRFTKQQAKIIIKKMKVFAEVGKDYELAGILEIKPGSMSGIVSTGKIPDRWFEIFEKKYRITKADLLKDLPQERTTTIADISYAESQLPQNRPPLAAVSDQGETYSPEAWKQLCLTHFGDLFDYIAEIYGNDPRAIERFKRDLRAALPDYRLWLYGEEEKKSQAGGSSDMPKAAGAG